MEGEPELRVHNLDTGKDFAKIQDAIDDTDTEDGHTITVDPGTYNENVIVDKSITLQGMNYPVIDAGYTGDAVTITADGCVINGFNIIGGYDSGIIIESNKNIIESNVISNPMWYDGIQLYDSSGNTIINNTIINSSTAIFLYSSFNNTLTNNNMHLNGLGVRLDSSSKTSLIDNNIYLNQNGISVKGDNKQDYQHSIDTSNTVNGKPMYYFYNIRNQEISDLNTAHLTIAASDNITLINCDVSGGDGVNWAFVNDSIISTNIAFSNKEGIFLYRSFNNKIINNRILNNTKTGISLSRSSDNIIKQNILELANWGIHLCESSENNVILCNNISINNVGLRLICCPPPSKNQIYHNNFVNNLESACAIMCLDNKWDNGYPSGGNYWSDYEEKYPDAKEIDEREIWDIPYDISGGANDNYPLMEPWGEKIGLPDLTLLPKDITFSNPNPSLEETITITATIHNIGEADVDKQFFVSFFEGPPKNNVLIDAVPLFNVDAKVGTAIAAVSYEIESVVAPEIFVFVDSNEDIYIDESNELNNIASRILDIIPGKVLPVPYFNQRYTEWCMYNSLAMVLQYYGVDVHSWDIAKYFSDNCFQLNLACQFITSYLIGFHDTAHPILPSEDCGIENYVTNIEDRDFYCDWGCWGILEVLPITDIWFDEKIRVPIVNDHPVIFGMSKHIIVFVGYSIENNIKYVYIHDPAGDKSKFKNELNYEKDGVFEKVPWETFKNYLNSQLPGLKLYRNEILEEPATPLPVIYLCDGDIFHTERGGKKESGLYLDQGLKYNTTNLDLKPDFDFGPNKRYLRWIDNDHLNYIIHASNPTSEPIDLSVDVELKGNNDVKETITIEGIDGQSDAYIEGFIEFSESGHEKLFITAKLNGNPVDQIGPIYINIIKPEGLSGEATCPVDLSIKDPDGLILSKQLKEIPGATYTERDINGDGDPDDMFLIPDRKIGDYQIIVTPEPDAEPSDTYTLTVSAGGTTTLLAENVSVSEIPAEPYIFNSDMNQLPRAFFSFSPENPVVNQVITLNASPSAGFITNYEWDFGDGIYGTGKIITHSYSNPGTYSVTLTVEDNEGNTDANTQVVEVKDISPTRDIPISTAANSQLRPTIAYNPANNEYLVTWDDKRSGSEREIYAQRVSGANSLVGSNFAIALSSGTDIEEVNPFVAYNPTANEYLVVWNEKSGYHNLYYIYAQRVSNTGSLLGDKITVSSGDVRVRKFYPTVAYNPANNEYLVVWYGQHVEGQSYRIYGQRLSSSGSLLASNFAIGEDIGKDNYQYYPQVAYNSHSNDYLVVWADMRNGGEKDIYAQKVSGSGSLLDSNYCICNAANEQEAPSVAYNSADNQYLVTWQDGRTGSNADIYAQMISGAGNVLGNGIAVRVGSGTSLNPSVTYNSKSNVYFVAWEEDDEIFAQEITSGGGLSGSSVVICDAVGNQGEPAVAYNSVNSRYLVTWQDYRNGNYDIYGAWAAPQRANLPPINPSLTPDKPEPQTAGTAIIWTASATDPEGDTLYYRFWTKGPSTGNSWAMKRDWSTDNTWAWHTSSADVGDMDISVRIRDGHHAPASGYDLEKICYAYTIEALGNQPPVNPSLVSNKAETQTAGTAITWTASATDPEGDTLYYRFWTKGPSTGDSWAIKRDWSTDNTWTWDTNSADIGDTDVSVRIRDGHHAPASGYDLEKLYYAYTIEALGNQPPVNPSLTPNKPEPQTTGTSITWTASATDLEGDTLYYRFWTKGPSTGNSWAMKRDWSTDNTWTWDTNSADIGDTDVSVRIRDGHHEPPDNYDIEKIVYDYQIVSRLVGAISVSSTPSGATIWLKTFDGPFVGPAVTTPYVFTNVPVGTSTITLSLEGYPEWSGTVTVSVDETTYVQVILDRLAPP